MQQNGTKKEKDNKMKNDKKNAIKSASKSVKIVSQLLVKNEVGTDGRMILENHKTDGKEKVFFRHSVIISKKEVDALKGIWSKKGWTNEKKYQETKKLLKKYVRPDALAVDSKSVKAGLANHSRERQLCYNPALSAIGVDYRKEYGKKA